MPAIAFEILRTLGTWDMGSLCMFLNVRLQSDRKFLVIPIIAEQMGM